MQTPFLDDFAPLPPNSIISTSDRSGKGDHPTLNQKLSTIPGWPNGVNRELELEPPSRVACSGQAASSYYPCQLFDMLQYAKAK